ncbi:hypothetical protein FRACA_220037 [Frankia canadensis]|uniref:Uncharacterized protein n=1 Tax=Frankia canadensis TaxID=1836972 RepID=A0A2I2KR03_9ACTN|nr:hypothetical protein FRACA_220037 [Frankia canadensis]SOU55387.1 hypothetical protein FRACA_220037 [Frankia canadensis]
MLRADAEFCPRPGVPPRQLGQKRGNQVPPGGPVTIALGVKSSARRRPGFPARTRQLTSQAYGKDSTLPVPRELLRPAGPTKRVARSVGAFYGPRRAWWELPTS